MDEDATGEKKPKKNEGGRAGSIVEAIVATKKVLPEPAHATSAGLGNAIRKAQESSGGTVRFGVGAALGLAFFGILFTLPWVPMNPPTIGVFSIAFAVGIGLIFSQSNRFRRHLVTPKTLLLEERKQDRQAALEEKQAALEERQHQRETEIEAAREHRQRRIEHGVPVEDADREFLEETDRIEKWYAAELESLRPAPLRPRITQLETEPPGAANLRQQPRLPRASDEGETD